MQILIKRSPLGCAIILLCGLLAAIEAPAQFVDNFDRSDSSSIGNNWLEKTPATFALNAGSVEKAQVGTSYRDNIVFRPAAENLLNVETSVEFTLSSLPPRYPQVFARVQTDTVLFADYLDAYILYVSNSEQSAILGRQEGGSFVVPLASIGISPALNTTDRFRLRLSVSGTDPVNLIAAVERFNGAGWDNLGQATVADASPQRINTAGSVGFGGSHWEDQYRYDNFSRVDLGGSNPQPVLTSINPSAANAGDPGFQLSVNGNNFVESSVVRWNGADRLTTFVSSSQLTAEILAEDLATPGTATIDVFSPGPGGGVSMAQTFTIAEEINNNPFPVATGMTPTSIEAGSVGFSLTVLGSDFVQSSIVQWNGADRQTVFVSASELRATISAADVSIAGTATVSVSTPAPGGGDSQALTFTIDEAANPNPVPVLASLAPSNVDEGSPAFTLTVLGSDFVQASVVRWNGVARTTTFVSGGELRAAIAAADVANDGSVDVTVATPGPGGGVSGGQTFTINPVVANNPMPTLTGLVPSAATEGDPSFTLRVLGSNFVPDSIIRWNGASRATTYISSAELRANIDALDIAIEGTASVEVFTPAPGGGTSAPAVFTISQRAAEPTPVPYVVGMWPVVAEAGSGPLTIAVWGGNFGEYSQVLWNGEVRQTYFSSNQELLVVATASDLAGPGFRSISVFNPAPGGGLSGTLSFEVTPDSGNPGRASITDVLPGSWPVDGGSVLLSVTGQEFTLDSVIRWNGAPRPTVYVSSQQLQTTLPASDLEQPRNATVTVSTPGPGGGTSDPQTFFVYEAASGFFYDNFNRSDSQDPGNGWTEKTDLAFRIFNGELVSREVVQDWRDNIVYRPPSEDRRDVEVAVEFRRLLASANLPQLHARVQRDSVGQSQELESYILFINDIGQPAIEAAIAVQPSGGQVECFIGVIAFPSELEFDERYRMRFRVTGDVPVQLTGFIDHWNGEAWDVFASGSVVHDYSTQVDPDLFCGPGYMPPPITGPGSTGVSKYYGRTDAYDNFYWQDFNADPGLNPVPILNTVSPAGATAGDPDLLLTVDGVSFIPGSSVRWNGADRQTTFVSSAQLLVMIPALDLANPGTASVTVFNPGPGGGVSNSFPLVVQDPAPDPDPNPVPDPDPSTVLDDFNRPDSAILGNGWIEKNPGAFRLANGAAQKQAVSTGYRDNVAYRPAIEDLLDVEASMEFRLASTGGYPQILTRVQGATASIPNVLDGYILYISNSSTNAVLGRQNADNFVTQIASMNISPALNSTDLYRMRLRTVGAAPVQLNAYIERWTGNAWEMIGQASGQDNGGGRISTPGAVGFGGYVESNYQFDNFSVENLSQ